MTKEDLNVCKVTSETIFIGFLLLLRSFWVVTWPVYDKFEFGAKIGWKMAKNGQKRPQMAKNDLNVWKMTFETIAIEILPLSRSFWVVTWLVCDNFFYGTQNGQKWPKMAKNGQKWPQNDPKWCDCQKNDWNWFISQIWSIFNCSRMAVPLSPSGGVWTGLNSDFAVVKNFWWVGRLKLFLYQNWP